MKAEDIFSFNFDNYESKLDLGCAAIIGIDIIENDSSNSCIIATTDSEVYRLIPESFSTCYPL